MISDNDANWEDANKSCIEWGGRLATIHSEIEQKSIEKLISFEKSYWIGFTDSVEEDTWVWVDGRAESYSNWKTFEPNNWADGGENCGEISKKDRGG